MSQPGDVCSPDLRTEPNAELADSDESTILLTASSGLPKCSSSSSISTSSGQTDKNVEASASLVTGWTDSKHSSYLDYMEANFVRSLYSREYCVKDLCGEKPHHHYQHHHSDIISEECDDDSAESQFRSLDEATESQRADHGDWTWRTPSRPNLPVCSIPWLVLTNPWVKHFRKKVSLPSNPNTVPTLNGCDNEVGELQCPVSLAPNIFPPILQHSRESTHQFASSKNPSRTGLKERRNKVYAFESSGNSVLEFSKSNSRAQGSFIDWTFDEGMANAAKRALPMTQQENSIARQKIGRVEKDKVMS